MRKILALAAVVALILALAVAVSAETGATNANFYATVSADGSCQVSLTATVHIEQAGGELTFPIPGDATGVTLNGSRVRAAKSGQFRYVDLSDILGQMTGDVSIALQYTLPDVLNDTETGALQLAVPILCGFPYGVKAMGFSVTLPGEISTRPTFSSGYHQTDIEKSMDISVSGAAISGSFLTELKDHETLTMTLDVSEDMFPRPIVDMRNTDFCTIAIGICAALALLYWLLFLRFIPSRVHQEAAPPEGYSAGQLGGILHARGFDLTGAVFSWAQLGYLHIWLDRRDRVLLEKRMDMGNERSEAERRWFRKLFSRRTTVDATGGFYTQLCVEAAKKPVGIQPLLHPHTGSPVIFRGIASGIGLFGGLFIGIGLGNGALLEGLLIVLSAFLGCVGGWYLQGWAYGLLLRDRQPLYISIGISVVWLLLGLAAKAFVPTLLTVLGFLFAGLLLAWGSRRNAQGRQTVSQTLGLRRYLCSVPKTRLQQICEIDPDYFFTLAPFALALGVSSAFARRFGKIRLSGCPYLTAGEKDRMTAGEWSLLLQHTASVMDAGSRQQPLRKFLASFKTLFK